jgi:hypothetical protein
MNKKVIIISVVVVGLAVGIAYLYNKRKKAELTKDQVTEKDALEIVTILGEKDTPFSAEQIKAFVPLYVANIKKETHNQIKALLSKKESDWTLEDKVTLALLVQKVLNPLKDKLPQPKK